MSRTIPVAERPSVEWYYVGWMAPERRRTMAVTTRMSRKRRRRHDNKTRRHAARTAILRDDTERIDPHENYRRSISWDLW